MKILFFILIILCSLSCTIRKSQPLNEVVETDPHMRNGKARFMEHCQKCHPNGEAGLGPAINSMPAPMFIKTFQIRHGLGVMPGFSKDEISKHDLRDMKKFMKALKKA